MNRHDRYVAWVPLSYKLLALATVHCSLFRCGYGCGCGYGCLLAWTVNESVCEAGLRVGGRRCWLSMWQFSADGCSFLRFESHVKVIMCLVLLLYCSFIFHYVGFFGCIGIQCNINTIYIIARNIAHGQLRRIGSMLIVAHIAY